MTATEAYKITPQQPIPSGFGPKTTAKDVLHGRDLTGAIAIVTGGHSGLGLETTRALASSGATVIVGTRAPEKARASVANIPRIELVELDLMESQSVDSFARQFLESDRPLHILINNAGIMATPLARNSRGLEAQFATNHLGHFQLTARLWPALKSAQGARVVTLSSIGHRYSPVHLDDPNYEHRDYDRWTAYGQSKTANILFALALDQRGQAEGVRAFSLHPGGIIGTGLGEYLTDGELRAAGFFDE